MNDQQSNLTSAAADAVVTPVKREPIAFEPIAFEHADARGRPVRTP